MFDEELLVYVRGVAEQLLDDLQAAEQRTNGWRDSQSSFPVVQDALESCLNWLSATNCWGPANRLPSGEFWRIAGPRLSVGSLQLRAREKPRGYAGDYVMLEKICSDYVCDDPLGSLFDRFFQSQMAPQAVRNRFSQIAATIVMQLRSNACDVLHVASVGSGPAWDIHQALTTLSVAERSRIRVTLLDLDPDALDAARRRIAPLLAADALVCQRENLFRMTQPGRAGASALRDVDLLICAGLFDYLEDADAIAMLSTFWKGLRRGGRQLVFNFSPANTSRAYMEWIGNWYLIYRDRADMRRLAENAGLASADVNVDGEATGANLYWEICKPPL